MPSIRIGAAALGRALIECMSAMEKSVRGFAEDPGDPRDFDFDWRHLLVGYLFSQCNLGACSGA